jgi:hypothetical protein
MGELASVGAALCAATGSRDSQTIEAFVAYQTQTLIAPDIALASRLLEESQNLVERYRRMMQENVSAALK